MISGLLAQQRLVGGDHARDAGLRLRDGVVGDAKCGGDLLDRALLQHIGAVDCL